MSIVIDQRTKIVVQGITGNQGRFHTGQMLAYGSQIVAGTAPGRGGEQVEGIPVLETVAEAVQQYGADASIVFVPAPGAKDAAFEAIDAGVKVLVMIPEHVPVQDAMEIVAFAKTRGTTVIGPNTFGIISPGKSKIGIMPNQVYQPGPVGLVARSGTLSYEIAFGLTNAGLGQTTVVGMGGDRVVGLTFVDVLQQFEADPDTQAVVMVGEIGGSQEELAADFIAHEMRKPVVAYIAGKSAPAGKRMGHAGAIIERGRGTFASKVKALRAAHVSVAELPWQVPELVKQRLGS